MKRCLRCNKIIFKGKLCNACTNLAKLYIDTLASKLNKINADITKGYKKLHPYFSRYQILLDTAEEFYKTAELISSQIEMSPQTYKQYKNNVHQMVVDMLTKKQQSLFYKFAETGEVRFIKDMVKLRDEMLDIKIDFPQFKEFIDINELQKVIDKTKLRKKI